MSFTLNLIGVCKHKKQQTHLERCIDSSRSRGLENTHQISVTGEDVICDILGRMKSAVSAERCVEESWQQSSAEVLLCGGHSHTDRWGAFKKQINIRSAICHIALLYNIICVHVITRVEKKRLLSHQVLSTICYHWKLSKLLFHLLWKIGMLFLLPCDHSGRHCRGS